MSTKNFHKPANWQFAFFTLGSGSRIRYGVAVPDGQSKGAVVVTGGYNNPIEYYYEQINNWRERGYTVYAMDWEGQGGSSRENPLRRDWPSSRDFEGHADTFHEFVQQVVKPDHTKPAFLSSHSKGGNIMLRYMKKYEKRSDYPFSGAILGAPLIDINTQFLPKKLFRGLVNAFNLLGIKDVPMQDAGKLFFTFKEALKPDGDPARIDKARQEAGQQNKNASSPHVIGLPTTTWLKRALQSVDEVKSPGFLENITTPILMLTPHKDKLVCVTSQQWAAGRLKHAKQINFTTGKHGIWYENDDIQKVVWHEIDHFTGHLEHGHIGRSPWLIAINQKLTLPPHNHP